VGFFLVGCLCVFFFLFLSFGRVPAVLWPIRLLRLEVSLGSLPLPPTRFSSNVVPLSASVTLCFLPRFLSFVVWGGPLPTFEGKVGDSVPQSLAPHAVPSRLFCVIVLQSYPLAYPSPLVSPSPLAC